ncbi:hypothetical protein [Limobrevibacterium gyesilva]|uniref:EAL domain-containing protein n=1 Tax=Limobrevibacterium gyesilva TaxID=2991712 RepID=A0AA42CG31_9PROT|nr:hypothetical protein [Limobrevibacterium gyesilva]MCW3473420.1 hypothetical protein [Limobrevibacterium gyesilva]
MPAALRGQVLLNLRPDDILADPAAFVFARAFAHARGYRLVLHEVTGEQLALLPLRRLGLDLVHLRWSAELARPDCAAALPDPAAVVLGSADSAAAIAWGRTLGIALYQGRMARPAMPRAPERGRLIRAAPPR